jgi:exopolysaccharide biosynthesis polyprenyl glycosylphosphotransferase
VSRSKTSLLIFLTRLFSDISVILFSIVLAYSLKFKVGWILSNYFRLDWGEIYSHAQIEPYLKSSGLLIGIWILTFVFFGLYRSRAGLMPEADECLSIIKASTISTIQIMAITLIYKDLPESRGVLVYTWALGIILLSFSRLAILKFEHNVFKRGKGTKRSAIMGNDLLSQDIAEKFFLFPTLRFFYIGHINDTPPDQLHFHLKKRYNNIGLPSDYKSILIENNIKVLFVTNYTKEKETNTPIEQKTGPDISEVVKFCKKNMIMCYVIPSVYEFTNSPISTLDFDGLSFIQILLHTNSGFNLIGKRVFDILFSAVMLILSSPIFIGVYLIIKVVSPGPVFYHQTRLTKGGKSFEMIKFRTMIPDAERGSGPVMVSETDENRFIKYGQFLRKSSIDELPQLLNVFRGEMSIVGPRPERPHFVEKFCKEIPGFEQRTDMKGGITGWAQINGRSVLTRRPEHKLKYDLYYIYHWSFLFDLKILIKTFFVVFKREEAY